MANVFTANSLAWPRLDLANIDLIVAPFVTDLRNGDAAASVAAESVALPAPLAVDIEGTPKLRLFENLGESEWAALMRKFAPNRTLAVASHEEGLVLIRHAVRTHFPLAMMLLPDDAKNQGSAWKVVVGENPFSDGLAAGQWPTDYYKPHMGDSHFGPMLDDAEVWNYQDALRSAGRMEALPKGGVLPDELQHVVRSAPPIGFGGRVNPEDEAAFAAGLQHHEIHLYNPLGAVKLASYYVPPGRAINGYEGVFHALVHDRDAMPSPHALDVLQDRSSSQYGSSISARLATTPLLSERLGLTGRKTLESGLALAFGVGKNSLLTGDLRRARFGHDKNARNLADSVHLARLMGMAVADDGRIGFSAQRQSYNGISGQLIEASWVRIGGRDAVCVISKAEYEDSPTAHFFDLQGEEIPGGWRSMQRYELGEWIGAAGRSEWQEIFGLFSAGDDALVASVERGLELMKMVASSAFPFEVGLYLQFQEGRWQPTMRLGTPDAVPGGPEEGRYCIAHNHPRSEWIRQRNEIFAMRSLRTPGEILQHFERVIFRPSGPDVGLFIRDITLMEKLRPRTHDGHDEIAGVRSANGLYQTLVVSAYGASVLVGRVHADGKIKLGLRYVDLRDPSEQASPDEVWQALEAQGVGEAGSSWNFSRGDVVAVSPAVFSRRTGMPVWPVERGLAPTPRGSWPMASQIARAWRPGLRADRR